MDWLPVWPEDALQHVAKKFVVAMNLSDADGKVESINDDGVEQKSAVDVATVAADDSDEDFKAELSQLEQNLVEMVLFFNETMREACDKYSAQLARQTYIIPTAYIQMLQSFSSLYVQKNNEITTRRDR